MQVICRMHNTGVGLVYRLCVSKTSKNYQDESSNESSGQIQVQSICAQSKSWSFVVMSCSIISYSTLAAVKIIALNA